MLPPYILFDLDDTLFDHTRASRIALAAIHAAHADDVSFDIFAQEHARVLEVYHRRFLRGELTLDQARTARMIELFAAFEIAINTPDALAIAALYRREHQGNRVLVEGARDLLEALQQQTQLGIVTNNATAEQIEKLRALNIAHFFDTIVISEDVGVTKPDKRIFEIALERLGARPTEVVMVGDSLSADIEGATNAGIASVWLNRKNEQTLAGADINSQKCLKSPATAGVSISEPVEINSLAPTADALAAIKAAFQKYSPSTLAPKDLTHANLETLAS